MDKVAMAVVILWFVIGMAAAILRNERGYGYRTWARATGSIVVRLPFVEKLRLVRPWFTASSSAVGCMSVVCSAWHESLRHAPASTPSIALIADVLC